MSQYNSSSSIDGEELSQYDISSSIDEEEVSFIPRAFVCSHGGTQKSIRRSWLFKSPEEHLYWQKFDCCLPNCKNYSPLFSWKCYSCSKREQKNSHVVDY
jgi:hypothetical protein